MGRRPTTLASGVRLTRRGRVAITAVMLALVLGLGWLGARAVAALGGSGAPAAAATSSAAPANTRASGAGSASAAAAPSASASTSTSAPVSARASASATASALPAGAWTDAQGYVHTRTPASGKFASSTIAIAPTRPTSVMHTYIVQVETSLALKPNDVATQVAAVLNDPRGWIGMTSGPAKGVSFKLVSDPRKAEFVIHLATAQTVNRLCPLDTLDLWSCDAGKTVLLNADRWLYRTPIYTDTAAYRAYMVNHEVGHFLGFGHKQCSSTGRPAPVMMQQSKGLGGCTANPWPTVA